jgi:DNA-binding SARP family transcriptional activator/Tfp pilus assembly protein PilF
MAEIASDKGVCRGQRELVTLPDDGLAIRLRVPDMEFRLLGAVEIQRADGVRVPLKRRMERLALAVLLLEAGRMVAADRLIDVLWGDQPPSAARGTVQSLMSRIRGALREAGGDAELLSQGQGYVLRVPPDAVDLHRFRALTDEARATGDPRQKSALLGAALKLWHGPALADAATGTARDELCGSLEEARFAALCDRIDADLAAGRHADLIGELSELVAEYPLREPLHGQLMLALYRCGRRADALEAYQRARQVLVAELGLEPGPHLRELETAIITDAVPPVPAATLPAQLPPNLAGFVGRTAQLRALDEATATVRIIAGTAGVGKTALAVHWAHRVRNRFPDGQLYVDLHGFDPSAQPMTPDDAIRGFLEALDVPASRMPASLPALTGLYRSLLAERRVLILLDNAYDSAQVRPLLPGSPGCLAVVTSRKTLSGLVATEAALPVRLGLLSVPEARELLRRRLGEIDEPAADEVIAGCARLPLALAIVAARVATSPGLTLPAVATELSGLDAFEGEDRASRIRAVFYSSYRALSPAAARLFRLQGLHPGRSMTAVAAACLAGVAPAEVVPALAELTGAHLVTAGARGRYGQHDLLGAYARELAPGEPDPVRRMLDHYLHTAYRAAMMLEPRREPIPLGPPAAGVTVTEIATWSDAMDWFTAERQVLLATIPYAAGRGHGTHAWQLAWSLTTYFNRQGHWDSLVTALAGQRDSNEAHVHRLLGLGHAHLGRDADAERHLRRSLDLAVDPVGRANAHHSLAWLLARSSRTADALDQSRRALEIYRQVGHRAGEARMLNAVGWFETLMRRYRPAIEHATEALSVLQELGDGPGQANTWDTIGWAHHRLGDHPQAAACYERALALFRAHGDRFHEADTLVHLGDSQHAAGQHDEARRTWRQALAILDDLGHADAGKVRSKLDQ